MSLMLQTFFAILQTFVVFALGGVLVWRKLFAPQTVAQLGKFTIDILTPFLIISSITRNFSRDELMELWSLPLLGFVLMAIGYGAGFFLTRFLNTATEGRKKIFHHLCTVNNYLFLPLIVLDNLWGDRYIGLLLVMNIGSTLGFWTVGIAAFGGATVRETVRNICSINFYAILFAVAIVMLNLPMGIFLSNLCRSLGECCVPLSLIMIGATIYPHLGKLHHHLYDIGYLSLVRLFVIPLVSVLLLKLLPVSEEVFRTTAVVALMPVSSTSVLIAKRYGGDEELAGQAILITTLLSIVSVPLLLALFL